MTFLGYGNQTILWVLIGQKFLFLFHRFEEQLMEIEKDIQTLSRRVVLVVDNGKSNSSGSYSSKRRHQASHW